MTGYIIPCFPRRDINFNIDTGASQELVLADRVELVNWRYVSLMFRVHAHSLGGTTNTILLGVYAQTISRDDPGLLFIDAANLFSVQIDQTTPSSTVITLGFPDGPGINPPPFHAPMVRVIAKSTRAAAGTISGTFSADISVKDS